MSSTPYQLRGYIGSRSYHGQRPPQHVQNLVLRDHCARLGYGYLLSATEYASAGCHMVLEGVLEGLSGNLGLGLYSLFMLPDDAVERQRIYRRVLAAGSSLHAAVEDLVLSREADIAAWEDLLRVAAHCLGPAAPSPTPLAASYPEVDFLTQVHTSTSRDYVQRVVEHDKAACAEVAKCWGKDYWDGDRRYGYGGYRYDGRWRPVAERMAAHFGLRAGMRVLDVGCGKAFLLHELAQVVPGLEVQGVDLSEYGINDAQPAVRGALRLANATELPYGDGEFDLAYSINTFHNLKNFELDLAFRELQRVSRGFRHVTVESYRNEREKANLLYWQLTCESFLTPAEWRWAAARAGYQGELGFIYFE